MSYLILLFCVAAVWIVACLYTKRTNLRDCERVVDSLRSALCSVKANDRDRAAVDAYVHAIRLGVDLHRQLRHHRMRLALQAAPPAVRPLMLTGAALADARYRFLNQWSLRIVATRWLKDSACDEADVCHGLGWALALRFRMDVAGLIDCIRHFAPWPMYRCLAGYGFGLALETHLDRACGLAALQRLDPRHRRAAFHGVGRFLYLAQLSDRRKFIETAGRFAPDHDADVLLGAGHAAAFVRCEQPGEALRFARAMPYEWREAVHAGLALGFHARWSQSPEYQKACLASLPVALREAVLRAVTCVEQTLHDLRGYPERPLYLLLCDRLGQALTGEAIWAPIYADAPQQAPSGDESAAR